MFRNVYLSTCAVFCVERRRPHVFKNIETYVLAKFIFDWDCYRGPFWTTFNVKVKISDQKLPRNWFCGQAILTGPEKSEEAKAIFELSQ